MSEWKLVPVQPTEEMIEAGFDAIPELFEGRLRAQWRCMLASAPQPPSQWPQPRPMSEAPKHVDARPPEQILAWWPASKEWVATWWWEPRSMWIHILSDYDEPQPTLWLPMPEVPTEQEVTK